MRKLIILFLVFSVHIAGGQTDSLQQSKKPKEFIATINTISGKLDKGLIYQLEDTSVTLKTLPGLKANYSSKKRREQYSLNSYAVENIRAVSIKRKNATKRGAVIGAGVGLIVGVVSGLVSGDDPTYDYPAAGEDFFGLGTLAVAINNSFAMTAGEKALLGGIGGTITGGLVGALVGALVKKKFTINADRPKFQAMKLSVLERAYGK